MPTNSPSTPGDLAPLLSRIEKLTGPDRETDALVVESFGWTLYDDGMGIMMRWKNPDGKVGGGDPPPLTASLDSVIALVERAQPEAVWSVQTDFGGYVGAHICLHTVGMDRPLNINAQAATPALSLLAALIRSLSHAD